jgi:hypothetical protein
MRNWSAPKYSGCVGSEGGKAYKIPGRPDGGAARERLAGTLTEPGPLSGVLLASPGKEADRE